MRILLGVAILVILALVASSRRLWSLRRTPVGAALSTGGWIMVAIGMLLGPHGVGLIHAGLTETIEPLTLFLLGWVGLIVGFGADRRLPALMPKFVWPLAALDLMLSLLLISGAAALFLWIQEDRLEWSVAVLLGASAVGWSPEVRSLLGGRSDHSVVTRVMRAVSGLGSIAAVMAFGLMSAADVLDTDRSWLDALRHVAGGLLALIGIGVTTGAMGMWLMRLAGRGQAEFIVVLVGLVSLVAGAAATMGYSPLFAALISGAVMVNLPHRELENLKRVILEAEQPIAMALMLVAGILANPVLGLSGLFVAMGLVLIRVLVKLAVMRPALRRPMDVETHAPELAGLMRQNPLAIALAVAYTAAADDGGHVLMMVILVGLIAETWPFLHRLGRLVTPASTKGAA